MEPRATAPAATPTQALSPTAPQGPEPLELALDFIEDYAVFLVDPQGRIASWNVGAQRLKGYAVEEAIGAPFAMLFLREDVEKGQPEREMRHAAAHGVYHGEGQRQRKDGSVFSAEVTLRSIVGADGALRGFVKVTRDITARKAAEEAARLRTVFEEELMGIVSHDLRNPLQTVALGVAHLRQPGLTEEAQRRTLDRMAAAAARAERLVHELLDFTQARLGGGLVVRRGPVDLHALAALTVADLRPAHPGRAVVVRHAGAGAGWWDPDRLAQLLHNLLSNALAYGDPARPITVTTRAVGDAEAELEVHSWGEPIPAELLPILFDRLTRGTRQTEGQRGSVGLGLFIVHSIARAHGGHVRVHSSREEGTTFRVRLPRAGPAAEGGDVPPATGLTAHLPEGARHPAPAPGAGTG